MRFKGKKPIFNYKDTFSLDETLKPIIYAGLVKFKEALLSDDNCGGFPGCLLEDPTKSDPEIHARGLKEWHEILDAMIFSFNPKTREEELPEGLLESTETLLDCGSTSMKLEVTDEEEYGAYKARVDDFREQVQYGFDMFGKYFQNLWW